MTIQKVLSRFERKNKELSEIRRKNCENKTFELIGVVNPFDFMEESIPGFVFPVFTCEQDGKLYMQEGDDDSLTLNSFFEIEPYKDLKNVLSLKEITTNDFTFGKFTINSNPIFAFQVSKSDCFIGFADEMKRFLKNFPAENETLKDEIQDFIGCGNK